MLSKQYIFFLSFDNSKLLFFQGNLIVETSVIQNNILFDQSVIKLLSTKFVDT